MFWCSNYRADWSHALEWVWDWKIFKKQAIGPTLHFFQFNHKSITNDFSTVIFHGFWTWLMSIPSQSETDFPRSCWEEDEDLWRGLEGNILHLFLSSACFFPLLFCPSTLISLHFHAQCIVLGKRESPSVSWPTFQRPYNYKWIDTV